MADFRLLQGFYRAVSTSYLIIKHRICGCHPLTHALTHTYVRKHAHVHTLSLHGSGNLVVLGATISPIIHSVYVQHM